jgi:MFS family permease
MTTTPKTSLTDEQKHRAGQTKRATASGWIGSALEFYDFFIYATAAALVFPQIFFPKGNPRVAIVASLATYGVGYVARPVGAFFIGHWGDTKGRKSVLLFCMFVMGFSTMCVGFLPTYAQVGILAPALLVLMRLLQGFAVAGEITASSSMILEHSPFGRRGYFSSFTLQGVQAGQIMAAAVFLPLAHFMPDQIFMTWGWRIPFLMSAFVILAGYIIRRKVDETPVFTEETKSGTIPAAPITTAFRESWPQMLIVVGVALANAVAIVATIFGAAYAVQPAYGIGMRKDMYLWLPVLGNTLAVLVIPFVGNLSDKIGRRWLIAGGAASSGLMSFAYLYYISVRNVPMALITCLLMWGFLYQGYNAVFPSFFPELFPAKTRVSGMAIAQNFGVFLTSLLPAIYAAIAPPKSEHIVLKVGSITFACMLLVAISALCARENYRVRVEDLGDPNAVPVPKEEYDRLREKSIANAG